jgi:hypothetical protein
VTLDITKIAGQIGDMVIKMKSGNQELREHLKCALDRLCDDSVNFEKLKRKIEASKGKSTWLLAGLHDGLCGHYAVQNVPQEYAVVATDGSHIDFDRNKSAHCFVINIGAVALDYGQKPNATLESYPTLYCDDNELVIKDESTPGSERAIDSDLLGIKRGVEECRKLAELSSGKNADIPTLALMDGTLILWGLEAYPDFVIKYLLKNGYLSYFDKMYDLSNTRRFSLASYISLTRSTEVVNSLRIAICPQNIGDCDRCQLVDGKRACDAVDGVQDYMLFSQILKDGERSDLFYSNSKILSRYPNHNKIHFFYLRVEDEIARVEVPEWVVMRKELLEMTHALVLDQCRRGQGYPVALSEAHEQAVVTGADREEFWELVEESLEEQKMPAYTSIKSRSKRMRWI